MSFRPRFKVVEEWDNSGNVSVYFEDQVSKDLQDRLDRELTEIIVGFSDYQKTIYHLEGAVNYVFAKMLAQGNLRLNSERMQWVWAEEV